MSLRAERKSPATIKVYGDGIRRFLARCEETGHSPELGRRTVSAFVADLACRALTSVAVTLPSGFRLLSTATGVPTARPCRKTRTSIGRDIAVPSRRNPFSSMLARCFDTDDGDRSPTVSPISRVLGAYPHRPIAE